MTIEALTATLVWEYVADAAGETRARLFGSLSRGEKLHWNGTHMTVVEV